MNTSTRRTISAEPERWATTDTRAFVEGRADYVTKPGIECDHDEPALAAHLWEATTDTSWLDDEAGSSSAGPVWVGRMGRVVLREYPDGHRHVDVHPDVADAAEAFAELVADHQLAEGVE